jgi:uncharacterized membrane protein
VSRVSLLAVLVTVAFAHHATAQQYQVTETIPINGATGLPAGAFGFTVAGVNDSGVVVGTANGVFSNTPFTWTASGATALALPQGFTIAQASGINSQGWVAGTAYTDQGVGTPTIWKNGVPTALPVPGQVDSQVNGLSNAGHVVGITGLNQPGVVSGFVWNNGTFTSVPSLGLGGLGQANPAAINSAGIAVGYSEISPNVLTATKWVNGVATNLGVTGSFSLAKDINEAGNIIVGTADNRAFIITNGNIQYISQAGAVGVQARAVNETGDVVGTIFYQDPSNRDEAFLYHDGQLISGSNLFSAPGIIQSQGLGVTDDGNVFVIGFDSQFHQTVLELSPGEGPPPDNGGNGGNSPPGTPGVPEPATIVLLGIAGLVCFALRCASRLNNLRYALSW